MQDKTRWRRKSKVDEELASKEGESIGKNKQSIV